MLGKVGIPNANKAVGMWRYDSKFHETETRLKNEGNLTKYCAVFETKGERRLATHLL